MEVVGELLLSAAFQVLFNKLASSDLLTFARQKHIHSQLKKWETQLFNIREVLNDAEDKQIASSSVKVWLAELRILAYDMEDILDEFNTEMLRRKLAVQPQAAAAATTSKVWSLIPSCCTSFTPSHVTFNVSMGSKIKDITSRLEDISTRKAQLGLERVAGTTTTTWKRTPTTSLFNEPEVHGRDDDKTRSFAYNDDAVVKHFSPRAWVCVSDEFDVVKITKAILNAISPQGYDSKDFDQLQVELSHSLAGKRGGLKEHAFENRDIQEHPNLKIIGKKIVAKCDGLPLAAKVLVVSYAPHSETMNGSIY
ncbi:putative disease resistance RPP13-like protein 1 [Vitis vinifera]|uniref:Putative disease resistance RPP13-like protein 1 n=1 Tax=Vitis vinifera TaxID=29760 RepID=A0A438I8A5_VITVI|nr:putative disease resistance RPP13-like protein 1 [Vitis vinifera]